MVAPTHGLIGSWSPGIGDPSVMGWVTVGLYFWTAFECWRLARARYLHIEDGERQVWLLFVVALVALGVNKQLDLQTALTEIGRMLAREEGWYQERRVIQADFIEVVGMLAACGIVSLVWATRRLPSATRTAAAGGVALVAFVVVRAASFHHVDLLLGRRLFGIKYNWALEIGGISTILAAACFRRITAIKGRLRR